MTATVDKSLIFGYIHRHVSIQNPSDIGAGSLPLRFNLIQDDFFWTSKALSLERSQDLAVKPRQVGLSTLNMAFIASMMINYPGFNSLWVSQDEPNAKTIRRKWDVIIDSLVSSRGSGLVKSDIKSRNADQLILRNGSSCSFTFAGAKLDGESSVSRGDTVHFAVFTESAYWADPASAYRSISPALEHSDPSIVWDSTANGTHGRGAFFYKRVQATRKGELPGRVYFWPWHMDLRYSLPTSPPREEYIRATLSQNEQHLVNSKDVTINQIAWRRFKVNDFGGSEERFLEAYPEDIDGAFIAPGRAIFDPGVLGRAIRRLRDGESSQPIDISPALAAADVSRETGRDFLLARNTNPEARVQARFYAAPRSCDRPYTIGVDTSEGVSGGDPSAIVIINREARIIGMVRGWFDPMRIASLVSRLKRLYDAHVFIEDQSTGPEVRRYMRMLIDADEITKNDLHPVMRHAMLAHLVKNNQATRPILVGTLRQAIDNEIVNLDDPTMLAEAHSFVEDDEGKARAKPGCHDDLIMALAIALRGRWRALSEGSLLQGEELVDPPGGRADLYPHIPRGGRGGLRHGAVSRVESGSIPPPQRAPRLDGAGGGVEGDGSQDSSWALDLL